MDIRGQSPPGAFHILFCRNLAFTYFDASLQQLVFRRLHDKLEKGGALVIGWREALPPGAEGMEPWADHLPIYRKT